MTDLLTRLQDASAGERSRGLDYEIHEHLGWRDDDECGWFHEPTETRSESTDWPHYTTSIDAAMTLVPEEMLVKLDFSKYGARASVHTGRLEASGYRGTASTPALALCIAALQAQQSKAEVA